MNIRRAGNRDHGDRTRGSQAVPVGVVHDVVVRALQAQAHLERPLPRDGRLVKQMQRVLVPPRTGLQREKGGFRTSSRQVRTLLAHARRN